MRPFRVGSAAEPASQPQPAAEAADSDSRARRTAAACCGWCGGPITAGRRGPIAKWCSATCRHRAWEQTRAAASGRSAVRIVERRIEIPTRLPPNRRDWPRVLADLTAQLDDGRVYDRDLPGLASAIDAVLQAYARRAFVKDAQHQRVRSSIPTGEARGTPEQNWRRASNSGDRAQQTTFSSNRSRDRRASPNPIRTSLEKGGHMAAEETASALPRLLTFDETAAYLRTPVATLRYWRHLGTGPRSFRLGRRVMFRREDVEGWLSERLEAESSTR
jgi:excisionase family DNA binding protein